MKAPHSLVEDTSVRSKLQSTHAIVTGGARGLGEAVARVLCEAGVYVHILDYQKELAEKTAKKLCEAGGSADSDHVDLRNEDEVKEAAERIISDSGKVDFLINNAAVDRTVSIEELKVEEWDAILDTNLRGPFLMSKFLYPHMRKRGCGHIVNIVSTASKRAWANASAYHASKWGLLGFSHALHAEARPHGVKVTAVVAGGMRTPFLLDRFPDLDPGVLQDASNVAQTIKFVLTQPDETVIPEVMVIPMKETSWP